MDGPSATPALVTQDTPALVTQDEGELPFAAIDLDRSVGLVETRLLEVPGLFMLESGRTLAELVRDALGASAESAANNRPARRKKRLRSG